MARPYKQPPVTSPLPPALLRCLRARGRDAALIAERFGLPADAESLDEVAIDASVSNDLLAAASQELAEPFLALALPGMLSFRRYRFGELSARASATLREGLARHARYLPLLIPDLAADLEDTGAQLRFRVRTPGHARGLGRYVHEYALAHTLAYARRETSRDLAVQSVWFAHARPRDIVPLYSHFETRALTFGGEDSGIAFARTDGDIALALGDERLLATVEQLAEGELRTVPARTKLAARVSTTIEALLPNASMEAVAKALRMSSRTLQRRMEDEDTRFSEVLDGVRSMLARRAIADASVPIVDVAARLGFSDLATFGRAFKRWTGRSPGMFRRSS